MVFTCPLCNENTVIVSKLCEDCIKVKKLVAIYGIDTVNHILKSVLVRHKHGVEKKTQIQSTAFKTTKPPAQIEEI